MEQKNFKRTTVTSALPYANGPVHIGHLAGVYVPADIYVRYLRLKGRDVLFVGGSDEHGVRKVVQFRMLLTVTTVLSRSHSRTSVFHLTFIVVLLQIFTTSLLLTSSRNSMMMASSSSRLQSSSMMRRQSSSLLTVTSRVSALVVTQKVLMATNVKSVELHFHQMSLSIL